MKTVQPIAYRPLPAGAGTFALLRTTHLWLVPPGAADQGARLRVWEYEGGALASPP